MKRLWVLSVFTSLSLWASPTVFAQDAPAKVTSIEGITEYRLSNGCRVLLFPEPSKPLVTVNMTVLVGSRHEGYGESGMAHLLEHMVFKGTPKHQNIPKEMADRGANFNGTTNSDRTNYFETVPAGDKNLEWAIELEADRLVNSYIKREDLMSEFSVVRSEFESGENNPARILNQRISATAFEWHNYGKSTIGNRSDIERVPVDNLRAFYKKYYQPDNVVVIVAGQFEEAKALELVQKHFGAIAKPTRELPKTYTEEPTQDGERLVTLKRTGDVGQVGVAYHIPSASHPDAAALDVFTDIISNRPNGKLYKLLVETKAAASAGCFAILEHDPGLIYFSAGCIGKNDPKILKDQLLSAIDVATNEAIKDEDVDRVKAANRQADIQQLSNPQAFAGSLSNWAAKGDWRLYFLNRDRLQKVTAKDVEAVAKKYLKSDNRTVGIFIPTEKPDRSVVTNAPDVSKELEAYKGKAAMASGETFVPSATNIDSRTIVGKLPEGMKTAFLAKKNRGETVVVDVTLRYGNEVNLKDMQVAASMLPTLMLRGTKQLTQQQFNDECERLGIRIGGGGGFGGRGGRGGGGGAGGGLGSLSMNVSAKKETLPRALELLRQVLREPLLPAQQFEEMKTQSITGMEAQLSDPMMLATNRLSRALSPYPKENIRYVPTPEESISRIKSVSLDQVKKLQSEYLGADNGEVTVVGDFDLAETQKLIAKVFEGWKAKEPFERIARPYTETKPITDRINTPDKSNANFLAAIQFAMREDDPDYPAMMMANTILGGGSLSSRLGDRVRQKEGLSYTVASTFSAGSLDNAAGVRIFAICNPKNIDKVEACVKDELTKFIEKGVTQEELDKAREGWVQGRQVRMSNDGSIANQIGENLYRNRTMAYQAELESKVRSLTTDDVLKVIKKYIKPESMSIVTGGDFDKK